MNYPPTGQHMGAPNYRPQPQRQRSDFQYPVPAPPQQYYPYFHQAPHYAIPHPAYQYQPQWYQPPSHYVPQPQPPRYYQPQSPHYPSQPRTQPQTIPQPQRSSHTPQPAQIPQPEVSTPSTTSQALTSPSTTPTAPSVSTSTPPVATPKPSATAPILLSSVNSSVLQSTPSSQTLQPVQPSQPSTRTPWYPQLPWVSCKESDFPLRNTRRRRRRHHPSISSQVQLPSRDNIQLVSEITEASADSEAVVGEPNGEPPLSIFSETSLASSTTAEEASSNTIKESASIPTVVTAPVIESPPILSPPVQSHRRTATKPVLPAIPALPRPKGQAQPQPTATVLPPTDKQIVDNSIAEVAEDEMPPPSVEASIEAVSSSASPPPSTASVKAPPKSWAELFARGPAATNTPSIAESTQVPVVNGHAVPRSNSLADALHSYSVVSDSKRSFFEPRGLANTGNMCYMNAILQVLVFCVPFYQFLDQIGKRVAHSFKSETPLIEAMIMFMREFPIIDTATIKDLRLRLKDSELEQYGDPFVPEYVYEAINRLPRFSSMRRGHQQDAEEFLGFLLEGLHDECVQVMRCLTDESLSMNGVDADASVRPPSTSGNAAEGGWLEVGPKQRAAVTQSSGAIAAESPITKIFGGKLRSVLRVPGSKDSVTLEPYQPLQLDIGSPNINNITDALKGLTHLETITGDFKSQRGTGTTATKQVFIETLPPVLILHLKRFQYDNTGGTQKIWRKIGYPLNLELPKEIFPQAQRAQLALQPGGMPKYELISAVYHHGKSAAGGHYTTDVRRQEGREWIRIDDTVIRRIRAEDVANEGSEEDPKVLAKALEQHKQDSVEPKTGTNIYNQAFGNDTEDNEEPETSGGWSQVNGTSPTAAAKSEKKWASVANGTIGSATPNTSTTGQSTPKPPSGKFGVKDNKIAYILFYQRV